MEEVLSSILYGRLEVEVPANLTLRQHFEIVRAMAVNPSSVSRVVLPKDFHPMAELLVKRMRE